MCVYGGAPRGPQLRELRAGAHLVVGDETGGESDEGWEACPFSHHHGSGKLPQMRGNYYWRDPFFTSMIMGGRVKRSDFFQGIYPVTLPGNDHSYPLPVARVCYNKMDVSDAISKASSVHCEWPSWSSLEKTTTRFLARVGHDIWKKEMCHPRYGIVVAGDSSTP